MTKTYLLLPALAAAGCVSIAETHITETGKTAWTAEQQAAYDQCLQDNMAVAIAWEMIEQSCREEVGGNADPLDLRVKE